jgi:hypothetical protein
VREPFGAISVCIPSQLAASFETHFDVAVLHVNIASQFASLVHDVPQTTPAQRYGAHIEALAASQLPLPLHTPAAVATPSVHEATRHDVVGPKKPAQVSRVVPSQLAALHAFPELAAWHAGRPFTGAPSTGMHVPVALVTLHASHCPVHGVLQQTPSTQNGAPAAQLDEPVQAFPCSMLGVQTPPLQ